VENQFQCVCQTKANVRNGNNTKTFRAPARWPQNLGISCTYLFMLFVYAVGNDINCRAVNNRWRRWPTLRKHEFVCTGVVFRSTSQTNAYSYFQSIVKTQVTSITLWFQISISNLGVLYPHTMCSVAVIKLSLCSFNLSTMPWRPIGEWRYSSTHSWPQH
jgi:hypothetical protein